MEKTKKITVVLLFFLLIFGFSLAHLCLPDGEISLSERRYLASVPELTAKKLFSGRYFTELETYLLDQFPLRETFRTGKAMTEIYLMDMGETNGITRAEGHLVPLEVQYDARQTDMAVEKMAEILFRHLDGNAYVAIVPDKNQYLGDPVLAPDMGATAAQLQETVMAKFIDLTGALTLSDYYTTDSHWRQENLLPVSRLLCREMGLPVMADSAYETVECGTFSGVYAGQSALPAKPDMLRYLVSRGTENALVTSAEDGEIPVYDPQAIGNVDPYDVYLGGPQAVITMENPDAATDRHLVIFRDSFGSSLAPLLLDSCSRITLVDLRYVRTDLLEEYVDFENADILFLWSVSLIHSASLLK